MPSAEVASEGQEVRGLRTTGRAEDERLSNVTLAGLASNQVDARTTRVLEPNRR